MSSFQQCTYCNKFLLSSNPDSDTIHATQCLLNSTLEDSAPLNETFETETIKKEHFQWITFPDLRIHLIRSSSTPTAPPSSSSTLPSRQTAKSQTGRKKKARVRYPRTTPSAKESGNEEDSSGTTFIRTYRFDCDQCPGRFYSQVEFDRHMNVHNGSRRLMKCIVCLRMFNKRDSLNGHYASHENAEEREEKLNLMHSWPKKTSDNPYARIRQACKYCLMVHTNRKSFVDHMNSDHGGNLSIFSCCLDNCSQEFTKIKDLLEHAKVLHPLSFFGKFTLNRIKGGFKVGRQNVREKAGNYIKKTNTIENANDKSKLRKKVKRRKKKIDYESDYSDDEIVNFKGSRRRAIVGTSEGLERAIELERVHIVDSATDNCSEGVTVKTENTQFYSSQMDDFDSFLMGQLTEQAQNVHDSTLTIGRSSNDEDSLTTDSVPIVSAIKIEPII